MERRIVFNESTGALTKDGRTLLSEKIDPIIRTIFDDMTKDGITINDAYMLLDSALIDARLDFILSAQGDRREAEGSKMAAAIALFQAMSAISESEHFASWLYGTELDLWTRRHEFPHLIELSEACGGWISWKNMGFPNAVPLGARTELHGSDGPLWVPIAEWIARAG